MLNTQMVRKLNTESNNLQVQNAPINQQVNPQVNPMVVNNFNIVGEQNNSIIVEHDKIKNEFTFKNANNQLIGGFSVLQLFKFINNDEDTFLVDINIGTSDTIIMKYIYNPSLDIEKKYDLISHIDSPFTSNIELLVKLYTDIIKLEEKMNEEILKKSRDVAENIKERNNKFIHNILIRILKLANTLIDHVKTDQQKRESLIRYSVGVVYKLSTMTQDELLIKKLQYETLNSDIIKLKQIQDGINSKLTSLQQTLDLQNTNIDNLIKELVNKDINKQGGSKSSTYISTTKSNTSGISNTLDSNLSSSLTSKSKSSSLTSKSKSSKSNDSKSTISNDSDSTIDIIKDNLDDNLLSSEKTKSMINSYKLNSSILSSTSKNTFTDLT
jgi:hypothetical protein